MNEHEQEEMVLVNTTLNQTITELLTKNCNPLAIAAFLIQHGLFIYKTSLPEADFDKLVDYISDNRHRINEGSTTPTTTLQ